jgi:NAD(P)-dependent dehydrogenase (short-subunit alcohol dehydrogenase family)
MQAATRANAAASRTARDEREVEMGVLDGRVAIVTGAGAGLGNGIAQELAKEGAAIAVLEIDADSSQAAAAELAGLGVEARSYPTDVADGAQVDAAFESAVRDLGRLDIVVNNAGISRVGPHTQDVTDEDWHDSIGVMQTGVFYCMRAAGRIMVPQGSGSVVNISSIRGFSPNPGRMTYSTPKAAVIMMTKIAAGEWAPHGVRVNVIAPGVLRTPMWDADVARGEIDEPAVLDIVPAHRLGMPWEVGRLVVYLCSDDAAYMTGAVLTIDGALTSIPAA